MRSLTSIEGNRQRLDGGALFGNAPKVLWNRWCEVDELNRITLACRALLVRDEGRMILFEAGIGAFFSPSMKERFGVLEREHVLLDNLKRAGVSPDDIDIVVLSHLHFDHAGGLLSAYEKDSPAELVFPNAQYIVGAQAWERAQNPHVRDKASFIPRLIELLGSCKRLHLVDGSYSDLLGEGYRFHMSDGHTPGMLLTEISMPNGPVLFAADLIPGCAWMHVPISMGYDRFPEKVIDEKSALLESFDRRSGRIFFTHDPKCALAAIKKTEGKYCAGECIEHVRELTG